MCPPPLPTHFLALTDQNNAISNHKASTMIMWHPHPWAQLDTHRTFIFLIFSGKEHGPFGGTGGFYFDAKPPNLNCFLGWISGNKSYKM